MNPPVRPSSPDWHSDFNRWHPPQILNEILIHTAKCDYCHHHNTSILYRCPLCGMQICTPCRLRPENNDGGHVPFGLGEPRRAVAPRPGAVNMRSQQQPAQRRGAVVATAHPPQTQQRQTASQHHPTATSTPATQRIFQAPVHHGHQDDESALQVQHATSNSPSSTTTDAPEEDGRKRTKSGQPRKLRKDKGVKRQKRTYDPDETETDEEVVARYEGGEAMTQTERSPTTPPVPQRGRLLLRGDQVRHLPQTASPENLQAVAGAYHHPAETGNVNFASPNPALAPRRQNIYRRFPLPQPQTPPAAAAPPPTELSPAAANLRDVMLEALAETDAESEAEAEAEMQQSLAPLPQAQATTPHTGGRAPLTSSPIRPQNTSEDLEAAEILLILSRQAHREGFDFGREANQGRE